MNEPIETKGRLIQVAARLFALDGYEGTSIRAITSAAEANLGAVTYHFGSKEELYRAVVASLWEPAVKGVEAAAQAEGSPLDKIEQIARMMFRILDTSREMAGILSHTIPLDRPIPEPMQLALRRLFAALGALIQEGQASGEIVAGNPRLLILSILAQPFHVTMLRRRMSTVVGVEAEAESTYAQIVDNAVSFIRRGLARAEDTK